MMDNVGMMRTIDTLNNQVQSAQFEQELFERYYWSLCTFCTYTLCAPNKSSFHINCFFFLRRMSDLVSINEALRRALSLRLYNRVDDSGVLGMMCHVVGCLKCSSDLSYAVITIMKNR